MLRAAYGAREALAATAEHPGFVPRLRDRLAGEVMLPAGAAPAFEDRYALWRAVDARGDHARAPAAAGGATGVELLLALPRLNEATVEEMADLVRGFCARFLAEKLAVQWDIHAPGSRREAIDPDGPPIAVHAHVLVSGRPIRGDGVLRGRVRLFDTVARPGYHRSIGWSREWRIAQDAFFARRGIPLAVAVPSGANEQPLGRGRFRPEVRARLARARTERRSDLHDPETVIATLLRHRWSFDRADLAALLGSVFPPGPARAAIARDVLGHPSLQPARTVGGVPGRTTAPWAERATRAIDQARRVRPVAAADPDEDWDPDDPTAPWPDQRPPSRWPGIRNGETLLEAVLRIADGQRAAGGAVIVAAPTTLAYARMEPARRAGHGLRAVQALTRSELGADRLAPLIIVPYAEMLTDVELADALDLAADSGATLLLLCDPDQPNLPRVGLLAELRDRGLLRPREDTPSPTPERPSPFRHSTRFGDEDIGAVAREAWEAGRPVVATGPTLVNRIAAAIRQIQIQTGTVETARQVEIDGLALSPGDRIVVVSAWDRRSPPRHTPVLVAGERVRVVDVNEAAETVRVARADGTELDLSAETGAGRLAYAGAVTLRLAIAAGIRDAILILDEPRTAERTAQLRASTTFLDGPPLPSGQPRPAPRRNALRVASAVTAALRAAEANLNRPAADHSASAASGLRDWDEGTWSAEDAPPAQTPWEDGADGPEEPWPNDDSAPREPDAEDEAEDPDEPEPNSMPDESDEDWGI